MDLEKVEALLELMRRYGCIQAKVGGIELTCDPSHAQEVPAGTLVEEKKEVEVSGDPKRVSRVNPLLHNKTLGLGPLLVADAGEKKVAP